MIKNVLTAAVIFGFLAGASVPVLAADVGSGTTASATASTTVKHPRVHQVRHRVVNQNKRIGAGLKNGTLTDKQAAADANRDAKIKTEVKADKTANGGHLTKAEQVHINKQLNRNSKIIAKQKADDKDGNQ